MSNEMTKVLYEISELGLVEVTSEKQRNTGTAMYHDPQTDLFYATYANGYVRRMRMTFNKNLGLRDFSSFALLNKRKGGKYVMVQDQADRLQLLITGVQNRRNKLS